MDLFANLVSNAAAIAEKSGISAGQVEGIGTSLREASKSGCAYDEAVKAAAEQNALSVEKIEEVLEHAGFSAMLPIDTEGLFGGLIRRRSPD
jgi:hypothetical protein